MGIVSTASSINTTAKGRGSVKQPIGVIGVIGGCCQSQARYGARATVRAFGVVR
jgi:hypothetical protein